MVVNASGRKGHIFPMETTKALAKGTGKVLKGAGKAGKLLLMDLPMGFASGGLAAAQVGGTFALAFIRGAITEGSKFIEQNTKQPTPQTDKKTSTHKSEHRPTISLATPKETKETSKNTPAQFRNTLVSIATKMQKMTVSSKTGPVVKYSSFDKQDAAKTQARDKVNDGERYSVKDQFGAIQTYTKSDNLINDERV